jgi:hypothetical protein
MAQENFNVSEPNDGLGDKLRAAFIKVQSNFTNLFNGKVDKETGKGLSTNDYTDFDKDKLANIEAFAEVNVQADFLQNDNTQDDFIKNKPTFPFIPEFFTDRVISRGTATIVDETVVFSVGFIWNIDNVNYQNIFEIIRPILFAGVGMFRTDVAYLNDDNDILVVTGVEDTIITPEPAIPTGTIRLMNFNIFGTAITPEVPANFNLIVGKEYVSAFQNIAKILFDAGFTVTETSAGEVLIEFTGIGATPTLQSVLTEGNFLTKTKAEIDTLILADELIPLMTYEITGVDVALYGGNTIYIQAINGNTLEFDGVGKFFNPKYDKAINGFGIWKDYNSYAINGKAIWGGKLWNNLTGVVGSSLDIFNLDATNWAAIAFNAIDYNVAYDKIKYDYANDLIVYRNEQNSNIVSTSKNNIDFFVFNFDLNPIASFQFGNVFDINFEKGIGTQTITNSLNENINFKGSAQYYLNFENGSYQYGLTFDNGSLQSNLTFDNGSFQDSLTFDNNSYQGNLTFDNGSGQGVLTFDNGSYQQSLTFENGSYQNNLTFDNGSYQHYLTFDNSSYQQYLTFDNGSGQGVLTFDNGSYQHSLTFDNGSGQGVLTFDNNSNQYYLTFDNGSYQVYLTETTGKNQQSISFDNIQVNRSATPMVANEIGLNFKGTLPTATTPTSFLVKEGNQVKEIPYASGGGATNLSYTPSPTDGKVNSDTGTDATLPLATGTNSGLLKPADFTQLSTLATDLSNKVAKNANITAATKTKITYDAKGLVTAGVDASLAELTEDATHRVVTDAQIASWNASIGGSVFQSVWNASTNTPALVSSVGTNGHYYIVNVNGSTNLNGITDWKIGDWAIFDGTVWRKVDNTDAVSSVNSLTGAVLLDSSNIPDTLNKRYVTDANLTKINAIDQAISVAEKASYAAKQDALTKATTAEINTGTDANKYIVTNELEASKYLTQSGAKLSATATGTNTYVATIAPAITAYASTNRFFITFTNANSGASTININGLGAKAILKNVATPLVTGDILAGQVICIAYDGTNFQMVGANYQTQINLKVNKSKFISQGYTQLTGVTGTTVIASLLIPANTYVSGESFEIIVTPNKSTTAASINFNLSHDTVINGVTNVITSATTLTVSSRTSYIMRTLSIDSTTLRNSMPSSATALTPIAGATVGGTTTFNPAVDNYITLTGNPTVTSEIVGFNSLSIRPL